MFEVGRTGKCKDLNEFDNYVVKARRHQSCSFGWKGGWGDTC